MAKKKELPQISAACSLMEDYAKRGVFRSFSRQAAPNGVAAFRMVWHRDRVFDLCIDPDKKAIVMPEVLPSVPRELYLDFKAFVAGHHDAGLPDHRRVERAKANLRCANHRGSVRLTVTVKDGDYAYGLQRLIHLVHETYLIFLLNGNYRDYLVEQLGADADIG